MVERHVYQTGAGGSAWSPLKERARITGGAATPHPARPLAHKYATDDAWAVVRDLDENYGRNPAPAYVADVAAALAQPAGEPVVEQRAHAPQSPLLGQNARPRP